MSWSLKLFQNIEEISKYLRKFENRDLVVIWDEKIESLYAHRLSFSSNCLSHYTLEASEDNKTMKKCEECLESLLENNLHRKVLVVAIGGGMISDFAGLVASLALRGLDWVVIPTTLLGMVDAAHGGKVAVNSRSAKNLIGHFHFPLEVFSAIEFLDSLPPEQIQSGRGEVLKYCFLSKEIGDMVLEKKINWKDLISQCAQFKNDIVGSDPKEEGKRILLNFGHTMGHLYEKKFSIPHGLAVAYGIERILKMTDSFDQRAKNLFKTLEFSLDDSLPVSQEDIERWILKDKKRDASGKIVFLAPNTHGVIEKRSVTLDEFQRPYKKSLEIK